MDKRTGFMKKQEQTLALIKLLALGNREIEEARFRSAEDVFADFDQDEALSRNINVNCRSC